MGSGDRRQNSADNRLFGRLYMRSMATPLAVISCPTKEGLDQRLKEVEVVEELM
jgi:hypothetical protein